MDFASVLRKLMDDSGITNYRLAKELGCTATTVANWLAGKDVRKEYIKKVADYFNVSTDYLLGEGQKEAPTNTDERRTTDQDLMFALWGDSDDIDEDDLEDVRRYAAFVRERKRKNDKTR